MEVTSVIWRIVLSLHRTAQLQRRGAASTSLGAVGIGVLNLAGQSLVRPKDAATELDVPAQSVTRAVADLERRGYIRRLGDESDGRSYQIELTGPGRRARQEFQEELLGQFARHLTRWDTAEVELFARQLEELVSSLAADLPARPGPPAKRNPWRVA